MEIIDGIEKKHRLHIDQAAKLSDEIYKLMLGVVSPQQFISNIESGSRIPHETAKQIATEVNEKIFRPVRESLIRIHQMDTAEESVQPVIDNTAVPAEEIPEPPSDPYREPTI
jgi:hypothetical protein